jgi:hypothetical protein
MNEERKNQSGTLNFSDCPLPYFPYDFRDLKSRDIGYLSWRSWKKNPLFLVGNTALIFLFDWVKLFSGFVTTTGESRRRLSALLFETLVSAATRAEGTREHAWWSRGRRPLWSQLGACLGRGRSVREVHRSKRGRLGFARGTSAKRTSSFKISAKVNNNSRV